MGIHKNKILKKGAETNFTHEIVKKQDIYCKAYSNNIYLFTTLKNQFLQFIVPLPIQWKSMGSNVVLDNIHVWFF